MELPDAAALGGGEGTGRERSEGGERRDEARPSRVELEGHELDAVILEPVGALDLVDAQDRRMAGPAEHGDQPPTRAASGAGHGIVVDLASERSHDAIAQITCDAVAWPRRQRGREPARPPRTQRGLVADRQGRVERVCGEGEAVGGHELPVMRRACMEQLEDPVVPRERQCVCAAETLIEEGEGLCVRQAVLGGARTCNGHEGFVKRIVIPADRRVPVEPIGVVAEPRGEVRDGVRLVRHVAREQATARVVQLVPDGLAVGGPVRLEPRGLVRRGLAGASSPVRDRRFDEPRVGGDGGGPLGHP